MARVAHVGCVFYPFFDCPIDSLAGSAAIIAPDIIKTTPGWFVPVQSIHLGGFDSTAMDRTVSGFSLAHT